MAEKRRTLGISPSLFLLRALSLLLFSLHFLWGRSAGARVPWSDKQVVSGRFECRVADPAPSQQVARMTVRKTCRQSSWLYGPRDVVKCQSKNDRNDSDGGYAGRQLCSYEGCCMCATDHHIGRREMCMPAWANYHGYYNRNQITSRLTTSSSFVITTSLVESCPVRTNGPRL